MSRADELEAIDRDLLRELYDLRGPRHAQSGGGYEDDPYPIWHRLRETGPVHEGALHELTGYHGPASFLGLPMPDRPHFTVFSFAACEEVFRDPETFSSSPGPARDGVESARILASLLCKDGGEHRRYRTLVQPSFVPARAAWWTERWIQETVDALVDRVAGTGRADLNVDLCAPLPVLTITSSFGVTAEQALDVHQALHADSATGGDQLIRILEPVVAERRRQPGDDLISVLVQAEIADDEGHGKRLSDAELYSFAHLLLIAGSLTTWKQTGTTLLALLQWPALLAAVRQDRSLLKAAIEESLRWAPTDPMFSRFVRRDVDVHGTHIPAGSVVHLCLGAANRDPARWERPDEYDLSRPLKANLAFGTGPHVCIGMHLARAEMFTAITAVLDRLPNLRLDPDAEPPKIIGMYHRGPTAVPVCFD